MKRIILLCVLAACGTASPPVAPNRLVDSTASLQLDPPAAAPCVPPNGGWGEVTKCDKK